VTDELRGKGLNYDSLKRLMAMIIMGGDPVDRSFAENNNPPACSFESWGLEKKWFQLPQITIESIILRFHDVMTSTSN
jgi:hypothetical protein